MEDIAKRMLEDDRRMQRQLFGSPKKKKKRVKLTSTQRLYIWEHPKMYGRTCSICHQRITKQSDMELDHTKAHSKGGVKMALAHKQCNKMKGSKSLKSVQKKMGFKSNKKTTKKKIKKKKRAKRENSLFNLDILR